MAAGGRVLRLDDPEFGVRLIIIISQNRGRGRGSVCTHCTHLELPAWGRLGLWLGSRAMFMLLVAGVAFGAMNDRRPKTRDA